MLKDAVLAEIDSVLAEYEEVEKTYKKPSARPMGGDYVDPPRLIASRIVTTLDAAINRLSPPHSTYIGQADSVLLHQGLSVDASNTIRDLAGILQAIRLDYAGERTKRFEELVHCDMFADLLEAAEYLMEKFSKDPAAVMVGGVLLPRALNSKSRRERRIRPISSKRVSNLLTRPPHREPLPLPPCLTSNFTDAPASPTPKPTNPSSYIPHSAPFPEPNQVPSSSILGSTHSLSAPQSPPLRPLDPPLEQHLRELCRKHDIDTTSANRKAKMIDAMNTDLAKQAVYNTIEQKLVTGWAGLRNAAAHGNFGEYDTQQVKQMIAGIREFIIRHPA